jgi:hypothetical protein
MERGWIKIRPVGPYQGVNFGINPHPIENG